MMKNKLKELKTAWAGNTCLCFECLDSTQEYAKILAKKENVHGILICAEEQTAGKGRRGRVWTSPKGTAIYMSLCLEPKMQPDRVAGLTLVMALAAAMGIREAVGVDTQIKWPNDLVVNGKKVCGILTEMIFKEDGYVVIIGTGINVNTDTFPEDIRETATSLKLELGKEIEKETLIVSVMKYFEIFYEQYEKSEDFSLLKEAYETLLANKDKSVRVLDPKGAYDGVAKGVNDAGNLIVVREDGSKVEIDSGEVSVRGIYGYV